MLLIHSKAWWLPNPTTNVTGKIGGADSRQLQLSNGMVADISTSPYMAKDKSGPAPACSFVTTCHFVTSRTLVGCTSSVPSRVSSKLCRFYADVRNIDDSSHSLRYFTFPKVGNAKWCLNPWCPEEPAPPPGNSLVINPFPPE